MITMKQLFAFHIFVIVCLLLSACNKESDPISPEDKTPYGTIVKIDDYPLYKIEYTSDYKFDQFLQTGNIPFYTSIRTEDYNYSCTCFAAFGEDTRLLGRNYDWDSRASYFIVFTNPPDAYSSVSTVDLYFFPYDHDQPPNSEANLNIVRTLPYYPFDGMNEKGVAVGMNALSQCKAPYDPSKVTIGELQLIRLVLDYAASTEEAISLIQQYNIRMENPPIHYLIADASGHSVIIEYVNGKMIIMENTDPWQVTTNFIINGLDKHQNAPCWRYRTAYESLDLAKGVFSESEALDLLQSVSVSSTRWSTVFNLNTLEFQITMGRHFDSLYQFSIK